MAIMFVAELTVTPSPDTDFNQVVEALERLTSSLRMNGQVMSWVIPISENSGVLRTFLLIPDWNALDETHNNKHVTNRHAKLAEASRTKTKITILGEDPTSADVDECENSSSLILYHSSLESPLRCGDCFQPIPLYKIPLIHDESDYWDIIIWQSAHEACDKLDMDRQIGNINYRVPRRGREICAQIESLTGKSTFYALYRYLRNPTWKKERARCCPGCGGEWFLEEPWHYFDFKCDPCRLVSEIAGGRPG